MKALKIVFFKVFVVAVGILLIFAGWFALKDDVFAQEAWEQAYNRRKAEVQGKLKSISLQVESYNKDIYNLQQKQTQLADEIKGIQQQIATTEQLIFETRNEIQKVEVEIDDNNKQIDKLKDQIRDVFVDIQSSRFDSVAEILLSSQNFDEVLSKLNTLDILQTKLNTLKKQTENKIRELEANKSLLNDAQNSLAKTQAFNQSRKEELAKLLDQTKGQQTEYEKYVVSLNQQQNAFAVEISQIDAQKRAEAERIARERDRNGGTRSPGGVDPGGGDYNACNGVNEATDTSGLPDSSNFTEPARGFLTVGFGCVPFYIYGVHDAIDIANGAGTPIYSIADGVVTAASFKGAWGNRIVVKHTFGNRRIYSLYAHLSSFNVTVGEVVTKGEQIGGMGNTGNSFGSHLHFTIMDETYEITGIETCTKKWGSFTYCFDPFLSPFRFY